MYTGSLAPASNREDLIITSPLIDDEGNAINLINADLYFYICRQGCPDHTFLTAEYVNGVTDGKMSLVNSNLAWQLQFTPSDMNNLCAGTYDVFMRCVISNTTTQIIAATIPIVEGGPSNG
jgi:hypothetical protein